MRVVSTRWNKTRPKALKRLKGHQVNLTTENACMLRCKMTYPLQSYWKRSLIIRVAWLTLFRRRQYSERICFIPKVLKSASLRIPHPLNLKKFHGFDNFLPKHTICDKLACSRFRTMTPLFFNPFWQVIEILLHLDEIREDHKFLDFHAFRRRKNQPQSWNGNNAIGEQGWMHNKMVVKEGWAWDKTRVFNFDHNTNF